MLDIDTDEPFEVALADLITAYQKDGSKIEDLISALEIQVLALREQEEC